MRGDGRIFQQKGSPYLWIAYYCRGKEHRELSKSTDPEVAQKCLRRRLKQVGADQVGARRFLGPSAERVTMARLFDALETDKITNQRCVPSEMVRLRARWQGWQAIEVNGAVIADWKREMLEEGLTPKTVRNYCQLLGQAFRLALEQEVLPYAPAIKRTIVPENARTGTFSAMDFARLEAALPIYLRDFARWAYYTGWRAGSIRSLRWEDIHDNVLTVRAQYSKTRRAQDIPLEGPLREIIERRSADRKGPYVFHYDDGRPIGSYKTAWATAIRSTGLKGRIFHDFRRTAATNLRRAGVAEDVAMKITGHATNTMFKRYRIVDNADVKGALAQRAQYEMEQIEEAQRAAGEAPHRAQPGAVSERIQ